ncbi:MAG: dual specificity protein phosphatase family protein [Patescibacteria group bacterium]|nr:dual specificity protein phosphatase family protein [Patescibacteria group bacterium]MDD5567325.1 dual specificity protein phosphatase family protein [Patescibacteria group bacterium]
MKGKSEFNYTKISKYIYLGTTFYHPEDMESIVRVGIKAVVDLNLEKKDRPKNLTAYLWLPARDYSPPTLEQFYLGVDFIDQLVRRRIKTYVHCNVGFGRAPTLIAAYLVAIKGYSVSEAIILLSHKRPGVHPNIHQVVGIRRFIRHFRKSNSRAKVLI